MGAGGPGVLGVRVGAGRGPVSRRPHHAGGGLAGRAGRRIPRVPRCRHREKVDAGHGQ